MSIDLSEFHDVFFEECFEGLDVMESGLLNLGQGTDIEEINSIFRAAHSIKGGGASFGFDDISKFTHVMETLLDEMRDGRRTVTRDGVDLLLKSVDCLRAMVEAAQNDEESDQQQTADVKGQLEAMLAADATADTGEPDTAADNNTDSGENNTPPETTCWKIDFHPYPDMLESGNEPTRIFRELERLGELRIQADTSDIPPLPELQPEKCYLSWKLEVHGEVSEGEIKELFSWVTDECDLVITQLDATVNINDSTETEDKTPATTEEAPESAGTGTSQTQEPPAPKAPVAEEDSKKRSNANNNKEGGSIRVAIDKVDELINLVGELVITQSMLSQIGDNLEGSKTDKIDKLRDGLTQLERNTRELQESVLQVRMLPISFSFSRFPRLVRDLSGKLDKKIELVLTGENTEVDKTVLEKIGDPLVHLVRNSLDHGLETPEIRKAAGKSETGRLELSAYHEGGNIIIKVADDGAGLNKERIHSKAVEKGVISADEELSDEQIYNLIFQAGFSTAEVVSDVSGRGVGMDVVRRNIRDLGGNVSIESNEGAGSTVTIRLPLTLAILDGQLINVGNETYIVSLIDIVESIQIKPEPLSTVTGQAELYKLREQYIPIIRLNSLFGMDSGTTDLEAGLLVVVEADGQQVGLFVDDLMGQQQVVIKSLETNFLQLQGISGATILGDGTVALILDIPGLVERYYDICNRNNAIAEVA